MKITFLSDTHLGFDLPQKQRSVRRRRGEDFFANTRYVLEQATASKSDLIIHGGDLFFRSKIPAPIIDRVYALLYEYADKGIPIIIVPGNHERSVLPQSVLLNHPQLYIFDTAETFRFQIKGQEVTISGFPNIRNGVRARFNDLQSRLSPGKNSINILLMHQAVDGAKVAGYTFRNDADTVNINQISTAYNMVLCGHIHRRQIITNGTQPVLYAGSIERTSFQEKDEPKGYYTIDWQNTAYPLIRFHELPARPMIDIYLDEILAENRWKELLQSRVNSLDADSIVRLRARTKPDQQDLAKLTAQNLRAVFPATMNVQLSRALYAAKPEKED